MYMDINKTCVVIVQIDVDLQCTFYRNKCLLMRVHVGELYLQYKDVTLP